MGTGIAGLLLAVVITSCAAGPERMRQRYAPQGIGPPSNMNTMTTNTLVSIEVAKRCTEWLLFEDWGPGQERQPISPTVLPRFRNLRAYALATGGTNLFVSVKMWENPPEYFTYLVLEKKLVGSTEKPTPLPPYDHTLRVAVYDTGPSHRVSLYVGKNSAFWLEVCVRNGDCVVTHLENLVIYD